MKTLTFKQTTSKNSENNDIVTAYVDSTEIGHISFTNFNDDIVAHIEHIQISEEYRGRGIYKMLLSALFNLTSYSVILSDCRNEYSNKTYKNWLNIETLNDNDQVEIRLENDTFYFEMI